MRFSIAETERILITNWNLSYRRGVEWRGMLKRLGIPHPSRKPIQQHSSENDFSIMNKSIQKAINDQANYERYAAQCYTAMSYWCDAQDYGGFAAFLAKQAKEEIEHAEAFGKHLLERGVQPVLSVLDAPENEFESVLDIAKLAQKIEGKNSEQIKLCYELSVDVKDYQSQPLLLRFIEEQVEEEAWAGKMVTLAQRAECPGALMNLDRHIVKELVGEQQALR